MVMVLAAITASCRSRLVVIDRGVKLNAEHYREHCIEALDMQTLRGHWDIPTGRSTIALSTLQLRMAKNEAPRFISTAQWPPKSPDANPLHYCVWDILENKVGTKKYQSVDQLKNALRRQSRRATFGQRVTV